MPSQWETAGGERKGERIFCVWIIATKPGTVVHAHLSHARLYVGVHLSISDPAGSTCGKSKDRQMEGRVSLFDLLIDLFW